LSSCSSKQSPVNDLERLSVKLEEEGENYTEEDWQRAAAKFALIEESLKKYEYTDEELVNIGRLKARCAKVLAKSYMKDMKDAWHDFQKQLEGASEELEGAFEDLQDYFESVEE